MPMISKKPLPQKYRRVSRSLKVKRSKTGLGLFTEEPIRKGEFIIEYTGRILTLKEADERGGKYLFETNKNRFIDGSDRANIARYINHACRPNSEVHIARGRLYIIAKKVIAPNEELNYDYGKEYFNEFIRPFGCKCAHCQK